MPLRPLALAFALTAAPASAGPLLECLLRTAGEPEREAATVYVKLIAGGVPPAQAFRLMQAAAPQSMGRMMAWILACHLPLIGKRPEAELAGDLAAAMVIISRPSTQR